MLVELDLDPDVKHRARAVNLNLHPNVLNETSSTKVC